LNKVRKTQLLPLIPLASIFVVNGTNPFPQIKGLEVQSAPSNLKLENQEGDSGKIRKQSQMAAEISQVIEFRKIQIDEKKKQEDDYCVEKCIDVVDGMEDLTDEQKADANELFQSEMNRQIFIKTKNPNVRLIWLKKKISQVCLLIALVFSLLLALNMFFFSSLFSPLIALDHLN
jgi:hypothetical protein